MTEAQTPRWTAYMPLDDVLNAPRNPKNHAAQIIAGSMGRFGIVELPALDERTGRLVAGHGRLDDWRARRDAAQEAPDGVIVEEDGGWLVPVSRGWSSLDDHEAEAYLITSNNSVIKGGWDERGLDAMLTDIAREDFALAQITGVGASQLEALLDAADTATPYTVDVDGTAALAQTPGWADPAAEAPWMAQTAPRYDSDTPIEHDEVPRTEARYAETPEQEAARSTVVASYQPRTDPTGAFVEMILVFPVDDRREVARLIDATRAVLGRDLKTGEVMLRAMRVLTGVLDRRDTDDKIDMGTVAQWAGWTPDTL